jgi:AGZA family xanthine/uracil permease-like MFS transporter|tara:strand:- start:2270 stop:3403 length:1134 start_codon:yes stop_codon:yes gene_type:complete
MEGMMENILTAIAVVINGIPQGILALSFGFAAFPTAIAFVIGIIGSAFFMSVATISFQAETITLAGTLGNNMKERLSLIFWGAALLLIVSLLGMNEALVAFIGPLVVTSMMAGVGIMLANVSVDLFKSEKWTGGVSAISALIVWFWTKDLAQTIIWSVIASTAFYVLLKFNAELREKLGVEIEEIKVDQAREKFTTGNIQWDFWTNRNIVIGALSLACLNIGANISFGKITGSIAGADTNIDHLAIYSSLADMGSAFFGGGPVEAIISGTAAAPAPVIASCIMMGIMAVILLSKALPWIGQYVHRASIAGFLFVLGVFVTFATNIAGAISIGGDFAGPYGFGPAGMVIGASAFVTAKFNPFYGLVAGFVTSMIMMGA